MKLEDPGLKCSVIKRRLRDRFFSEKFSKYLRKPILKKIANCLFGNFDSAQSQTEMKAIGRSSRQTKLP